MQKYFFSLLSDLQDARCWLCGNINSFVCHIRAQAASDVCISWGSHLCIVPLPDSVSGSLIGLQGLILASDWLKVEHLLFVSWKKTGPDASLLNLSTLVRLISSDITQRSDLSSSSYVDNIGTLDFHDNRQNKPLSKFWESMQSSGYQTPLRTHLRQFFMQFTEIRQQK